VSGRVFIEGSKQSASAALLRLQQSSLVRAGMLGRLDWLAQRSLNYGANGNLAQPTQ